LLLVASVAPVHPVAAQEDDVSELIALINGLRDSYGLEPYIVDQGLMALAQEHSEYQASIHTSTHQHSDGRTPPQIGVVENVAGGDLGYLDPQAAVYEIWADPVHGRTMIGFSAGSMGVGIADDGITVYYTLEVRPGDTPASAPGTSGTGTGSMPLTLIPFATLVPATPNPDGSIVHLVGYGQTLWSIALAYGIQIEQIRWWNNIDTGSNDIYVGQKLLVRPANLVMASPTLPAEPGTPQIGDILVSTPIITVEATLTASPPSNTPTVSSLAVLRPTSAETEDDNQGSSKDSPAESGLLVPFLAGGSILIGCALLLILRINNKRNYSDY
jgi:LysM repeat protein